MLAFAKDGSDNAGAAQAASLCHREHGFGMCLDQDEEGDEGWMVGTPQHLAGPATIADGWCTDRVFQLRPVTCQTCRPRYDQQLVGQTNVKDASRPSRVGLAYIRFLANTANRVRSLRY